MGKTVGVLRELLGETFRICYQFPHIFIAILWAQLDAEITESVRFFRIEKTLAEKRYIDSWNPT